jgi:hypothetical protein
MLRLTRIKISLILKSVKFWGLFLLISFLVNIDANSQINPGSPANWLHPDGNSEATKYLQIRSQRQEIDSFFVKWSNGAIAGDVKPLIGNVINNDRIFPEFGFAPNEIAAVIGNELVILEANGNAKVMAQLPPFVNSVSVLFDTLGTQVTNLITNPVVLGLSSMEHENLEDSLAYAYIAGHNQLVDTMQIIKRLAIDLRDFDPNIFAGITPVFGRRQGEEILIYATVNMANPSSDETDPIIPTYFRGFTQFNTGTLLSHYPLPDFGDDLDSRVTMGPMVGFAQPSMSLLAGIKSAVLLPSFATPNLQVTITNPVTTIPTSSENNYLTGLDMTNAELREEIVPYNLSSSILPEGSKARIRSYYLHLTDAQSPDSIFILIAEEYTGIDGSTGQPRLHLSRSDGDPITFPGDPNNPPMLGDEDHLWSVAVGNVDGFAGNTWLPYYPNNPGKEIIVTQSTREFSVAKNRLSIYRYRSGPLIDKPSPPNTFLYPFDTVCTQRVNGWLAAVNDLDGASDQKDEIVLVDGSTLRVMRLRDYDEYEFRMGMPFDTVFSYTFPTQTISNVAIADLEGDGKNDIIVTTFDSTYVIGDIIANSIEVLYPKDQPSAPKDLCAGDTIAIIWYNKINNFSGAAIGFVPTFQGIPIDTPRVVVDFIPNEQDTIRYYLEIDSTIGTGEGRFVVFSPRHPTKIWDTTSVINFHEPHILVDSLERYIYRCGDDLTITGEAFCVDSVALEYWFQPQIVDIVLDSLGIPDTTWTEDIWTRTWTAPVRADGSFTLLADIPCLPFFTAAPPDKDSLLYLRVLSFRGDYADTSDQMIVNILPSSFKVGFDTSLTADPTKFFEWDMIDFDFDCDTVYVGVSLNGGRTYTTLGIIDANEEEFIWEVPVELPDSVIVRFFCENSCIRTDTVLNNVAPTYIDIVAPNPFNPISEELQIVYQVPSATNVTIRIFDQANRLVAEPVKSVSRQPGIAYADQWNGRRWDGSPCDNGMYYISLEFSNGIKEIYHLFIRK